MEKKELTDKQLTIKAETYCASAERCPSDVEAKLAQWGADEDVAAAVMKHLFDNRYLDAERYCRFFVRDKYRFNQWGRNKIVQALKLKRMSAADINAALEEINEEEYNTILRKILAQKKKSIKARNDYELNTKLIRFAIGRGFTMGEVLRFVKDTDIDEFAE